MLNIWMIRLTTLSLWGIAAGSAAFWSLQQVGTHAGSPPKVLDTTSSELSLQPPTQQVALALGAKEANGATDEGTLAAAQARFQLVGVLAQAAWGHKQGVALLSVDGKPAKPYRIGVAIEDGFEVTALTPRTVSIGSKGTAAFTLELPLKN
jgi:general secretion pathway protein C